MTQARKLFLAAVASAATAAGVQALTPWPDTARAFVLYRCNEVNAGQPKVREFCSCFVEEAEKRIDGAAVEALLTTGERKDEVRSGAEAAHDECLKRLFGIQSF